MNNNEKIEITDAVLMAYITDELDSGDRQFVSDWIVSSVENRAHFEGIEKAWVATGKVEPKPVVVNTDAAWSTVLEKIGEKGTKVIPIQPKSNRKTFLSIAAMIVVLLGVFSVLKFVGEPQSVTLKSQNEVLVDELEDGSVITLNRNSSLVYPEAFGSDERRVSLKGEAFFNIARNEEKPFIIDLPAESYVKVLGTTFNITTSKNDSITEVFVSTGKVEFGSADTSIVLLPGEKGIFNKNSGAIYKENNATTGIKEMYWFNGDLDFDDVPLHEVVAILNEVFPETINIGCEEMKDLPIVSNHKKDESIADILEVIANVHGLKVDELEGMNHSVFRLNCND
jgi:ferric-dicitrate binding protein FerR (iron transport regulator)